VALYKRASLLTSPRALEVEMAMQLKCVEKLRGCATKREVRPKSAVQEQH